MSDAFKLVATVLLSAQYTLAQNAAPASNALPMVLQKNEGEVLASPTSDFIIKIGPKD
jgi:hypothetical protein